MLGVIWPARSTDPFLKMNVADRDFERANREKRKKDITRMQRQLPKEGLIPKVIVYRDSFFTRLARLTAVHCNEMLLYPWGSFPFNPIKVAQAKPTLVIYELVERNLAMPSPAQLTIAKKIKKIMLAKANTDRVGGAPNS